MSIQYVKCPHCGNTDFKTLADTKPEDVVTCTQCGFKTTFADLQARLHAMVEKTVDDAVAKFRENLRQIWK